MRKKIALYVNGWNAEIIAHTVQGMRRYGRDKDFDLFVLNCFASYDQPEEENKGELTVYEIPDVKDFDGVVILANSCYSEEVARNLGRQALENHVPAVSIGLKIDGISHIAVDNHTGMRRLVNHLIEDHGCKRITYIGGTPEHIDSNERLQVTREVLKEHGLSIAEDDVYYGYWTYMGVLDVLMKMLEKDAGLPDAIVCANDTMALAAISDLTNRGYRVPEDVLVTGFDYVDSGKHFYPSLTSVELDFEQVGEYCCQILLDEEKEALPVKMNSVSRAVFCESCGCFMDGKYEKVRQDFCRRQYSDDLMDKYISQTERVLESAILGASDFSSLKGGLDYQFRKDRIVEGNDFHLILDSRFFQNILEDYKKVLENGMQDEMSVLVSKRAGKLLNVEKVNRHELVPGYAEETKAHTYYINTLHLGQYSIGYIIFVDESFVVTDDAQYSYINRIRQALHALRINMRLDALNKNLMALYNRDAMTGLYNRFGYENLALPLFEQCHYQNEQVMVCFLDINYMKRINDVYGHLQGDMAIVIVANAIKRNERGRWIAIRYGGDEFLIIAACKGTADAEGIKQSILDTVAETARERGLPYEPSVSCGYVITDPRSGLNLQDYIKAADEVMYEIKREVHSRD